MRWVTRIAMLVALVILTRRALITPSGELLGLGPAHALRLQSAEVAEPMPRDAGLRAIQEAIRQAGYGDVLPFLPLLLLGAGGVLVYFGCAWLPEELSELPAYYYLSSWASIPTALGMIIVGGWLIYLGCESSR